MKVHSLLTLVTCLTLTACAFVGEQGFQDKIEDFDGDGVIAERFGGEDCADDNPDIRVCDKDKDGFRSVEAGGDDCDDDDANIHPEMGELCNAIDDDCDGLIDDADDNIESAPGWFADDDGDGFGDPNRVTLACEAPSNHVDDSRDCDDGADWIHPGAPEFCDDIDRNCDGDPYADSVDPLDWYIDDDGDGYGFGESQGLACTAPAGGSLTPNDCDDTAASAYPGAIEIWYDDIDQDCDGGSDWDKDGDGHDAMPVGGDCNDDDEDINPDSTEICNGGVDDNCNGVADNDDPSTDSVGQWIYYLDADQDGAGDDFSATPYCPNTAPAGWILIAGDCDDTLDNVLPGGSEVCDNRDNDCDGVIDDGAIGMVDYYLDGDGDGYGGDTIITACDQGPGLAAVGGDCNDADAQTYPGAPEICGDLFRQDCSALSIYDCDSDGFIDINEGGDDCDDSRDDVYPGGNEVCDGHDNDCDGLLDDQDPSVDLNTIANWYTDADGDGHGGPNLQLPNACAPVPGAAANSTDCDDNDPNTHPDATEICDGLDNTCDGVVDELPLLSPPEYHYDGDGDGFGSPTITSAIECDPPGPEWILDATDCHDGFADMNPLAQEICDGLDNDCDGDIDDADSSVALTLWYLDDDNDGYGQTGVAVSQCDQPAGHSSLGGDCNDFDPDQNPGASEVCDGGLDNDCDGLSDDADPDLAASTIWYPDDDNDGYGDASQSQAQCVQPPGWVNDGNDCDDTSASVSPAAIELCDGVDNDCDTLADDDDDSVVGAPFWFADLDDDGWGDDAAWVRACLQPQDHLPQSGDCDDTTAAAYPNAPEVCDAIDNDCDGLIDDADGDVILTRWHEDNDLDGSGNPLVFQDACQVPMGNWVDDDADCDDENSAVNPQATEVCNLIDDDCDGLADDQDPGVVGKPTWWVDNDQDGYGVTGLSVSACSVSGSWANIDGDCDDDNPDANPGILSELCNGFDDDCNGQTDDADPGVTNLTQWYLDADNDGAGSPGTMVEACDAPAAYVADSGDCNDSNADINPSALEVCDGTDNDCDSLVDDDDGNRVGGSTMYTDTDGDGFGDPNTPTLACSPGPGTVTNPDDCNDSDPQLYAGQVLTVSPAGGSWPTISSAIAAACEDGAIQISGGTWSEQLDFQGKKLTVGGVDPNSPVTLNAPASPAVIIANGESAGTTLENIHITAPASGLGGGLRVANGANVTVRNVSFDGIVGADSGGAAYIDNADATFEDCEFFDNEASASGGAIAGVNGATISVVNSVFDRNLSGTDGDALSADATELLVVDSTFTNHQGNEVIYASGTGAEGTTLVGIDMWSNNKPVWLRTTNVFVDNFFSWDSTGDFEVHGIVAPVAVEVRNTWVGGTDTALRAMHFRGQNLVLDVSNVVLFANNTDGLHLTDVTGAKIDNISVVGNAGWSVLTLASTGDIRNALFWDNNSLAGDLSTDATWNASSTVTYSIFSDLMEAQSWSNTNTNSDPLLQTYHPSLEPLRWDLHPVGNGALNQGDPAIADEDGTRSDIGAFGGPQGDAAWYEDKDADAIFDGWENHYFGSTTATDGFDDPDQDSINTLNEFIQGTLPTNSDSDADGSPDWSDSEPLNPMVL